MYNYNVRLSIIFVIVAGLNHNMCLQEKVEKWSMKDPLAVGRRIKELRTIRGLSLRALAEKSGLSTNAISQIERGGNSPTVSSLHSLANALAVPITSFFEQQGDGQVIHLKHQRRPISEAKGVSMENLGSGLPNQQLEPFLMTLQPGFSSTKSQITHPGEEFAYVLGGFLNCLIGEREYQLKTGDSLLFLATQPHRYTNPTLEEARMIIIFQPMTGELMAHQHYQP